ncbi:MAG: response regulator transcription factor [Acidobacteriia bacterium]|nr:response regulator transcription factor [Terriglobia bacterium]
MKALIVDDEPIARQILRELLEDCPGVQVAGEASTGVEALQRMITLRPDVVFMDYEMPGLDGLATVNSLQGPSSPAIIFVTAYQQHALAAFDAGAVDYLLKPVRKERLQAALKKIARPAANPGGLRKVMAQSGSDIILIDTAQVAAFQADGETIYILSGKNRYPSTYTLKALESLLPSPPFRRIHRQTIINTDHIRRISPLSSRRWLLTLTGGLEVIVSKRLATIVRSQTNW